MLSFVLTVLPFLTISARALNDWSVPCFGGECSYDLSATSGASGSLKIWGSQNAITDVTKAAGWTIIGCDPNAMAQNIRLLCTSDDTAATGCDHLYQNSGAINKIVRLPENCGAMPFARIANAWVDQNQSIPENVARSLVRRAGTTPQVKALALDTNFTAVDPQTTGDVNVAIQGTNVPGQNGNLTITPPTSRRRSRLTSRGLLSIIEDSFDKFNSFDENITKDLPPIDVDKSFPIFSDSVSCPAQGAVPATTASFNIDASAKAHSVITLGVAAAGTIIPPKLTDFGVYMNMDADLTGSITLKGSATGVADSGRISLFEVGIPGLEFPGVLSVGPSFKIEGQAKATLDIDVDMTVDLSYSVQGAKLFFPASQNHASGGNFVPGQTPLQLSVSPAVTSKGVVEVHLVPKLDLGISALGGAAEATVFVELDNSAAATLTLNGQATAGATLQDGQTSTSASASVDGCASVDGDISVNAGADGAFFGIFDASTSVSIFDKKFQIFKKCFGASTTKRELSSPSLVARSARLSARALTCPNFASAQLVSLSA